MPRRSLRTPRLQLPDILRAHDALSFRDRTDRRDGNKDGARRRHTHMRDRCRAVPCALRAYNFRISFVPMTPSRSEIGPIAAMGTKTAHGAATLTCVTDAAPFLAHSARTTSGYPSCP